MIDTQTDPDSDVEDGRSGAGGREGEQILLAFDWQLNDVGSALDREVFEASAALLRLAFAAANLELDLEEGREVRDLASALDAYPLDVDLVRIDHSDPTVRLQAGTGGPARRGVWRKTKLALVALLAVVGVTGGGPINDAVGEVAREAICERVENLSGSDWLYSVPWGEPGFGCSIREVLHVDVVAPDEDRTLVPHTDDDVGRFSIGEEVDVTDGNVTRRGKVFAIQLAPPVVYVEYLAPGDL